MYGGEDLFLFFGEDAHDDGCDNEYERNRANANQHSDGRVISQRKCCQCCEQKLCVHVKLLSISDFFYKGSLPFFAGFVNTLRQKLRDTFVDIG